MREIKFKAWNLLKKEWRCDINNPYLLGAEYDENDFKNCIFLQYIEHKDVDGTEIYEGDIVEYDFYASCSGTGRLIETIEWDKWKNGWCHRDFLKDSHKNNIKIIGNIYETSSNRIKGF